MWVCFLKLCVSKPIFSVVHIYALISVSHKRALRSVFTRLAKHHIKVK